MVRDWTSSDKWLAILDYPRYCAPTVDLLLWSQNTLLAGDPQCFLNVFSRSDGGSDCTAPPSSATVPRLDDLGRAESHADPVLAAAVVHATVHEEVPAGSPGAPTWHLGFGRWLPDYQPWGSNYHGL